MKPTFQMFLSEHVLKATFNRVNFLGAIMSPEVTISTTPYTLMTNVVLLLVVSEDMLGSNVSCELSFAGTKPEYEINHQFGDIVQLPTDDNLKNLTLSLPLDIKFESEGKLQVVFRINDVQLVQDWVIKLGDAPGRKPNAPSVALGMLGSKRPTFSVADLLQGADHELIIIDAYMDANSLRKLVGKTSSKIKLLTTKGKRSAQRQSFKAASAVLSADIPNLEVRFSKGDFHDRFVILNGCESYAFGASLKDLDKKTSVFHKIFDAELHYDLVTEFNLAWPKAQR